MQTVFRKMLNNLFNSNFLFSNSDYYYYFISPNRLSTIESNQVDLYVFKGAVGFAVVITRNHHLLDTHRTQQLNTANT